ncbi:cytosolic sulfotransferase 3-like [Hoplias malabaricus]|uniref:cytosolic sulfotransferase 3-like n=1 Tax=Hoplias malabaricus TaxID=27720 RepID=UPI0034622D6F
MQTLGRSNLIDFKGISMINIYCDNWENYKNFQARPDDVLIVSYPKAGSTWMSNILDLLYFGNTAPERQTSVEIFLRVPFLEAAFAGVPTGVEMAEKLSTRPRIMKTHYPVQLLPKSFWEQNCKIVYVARNPKDNAVSFYHFDRANMTAPHPGEWKDYLENFIDGRSEFGPWYDHVRGYWEKKQTYSNIHYMFYEDMVGDTVREFEGLCSFLGLSPSVEDRERVIQGVHFEQMKQNKMTNYTTVPGFDTKETTFMRKGKVGDWKNHFTVAQNEKLEERYKQKMKNTTLQFRTEI